MSRRALLVPAAVAALVAGALAGCGPHPEPDASPASTRHAAPDGSGTACTEASPCALDEAIAGSRGGEVLLAAGEYGDLELAGGSAAVLARTARVVVEPVDGADVALGKLTLDLPTTTWRGVTITGGVYLDEGANGTELEAVHVDGSGVFVHATGVRIRDSVIENGRSIDGIQIARARDVLVEGSVVRGFIQEPGSDVHSDCVQLFDSSRIVLRGNYLGDCDNAGLIFSPGGHDGISDVLVEANHIQGCVSAGDCSGGTALDLRAVTTISGVVVRNNTILDGAVRVEALDGLVFDRNIVGYASNCAMPMTNSIVVSWNTGNCDRPDALGRDGNRAGEVRVQDREGGDLSPVDPQDTTIDPTGPGEPAAVGFDGEPLPADRAGAGG